MKVATPRFNTMSGCQLNRGQRSGKINQRAVKKHGMFVADSSWNWQLSIAPDPRLEGLEALLRVHGRDFEVVETTGPEEGPRRW